MIMPDHFKGTPGNLDWYSTDGAENVRLLRKFEVGKSLTPQNLPMVIQMAADAKLRWSYVKAWSVFGLCWGRKVSFSVASS